MLLPARCVRVVWCAQCQQLDSFRRSYQTDVIRDRSLGYIK